MRQTNLKGSLLLCMGLAVSACTATQPSTENNTTPTPSNVFPTVVTPAKQIATKPDSRITLEQIMSDPTWLGRQPEKPQWSVLGDIVYQRQQSDTKLNDVYYVDESGKSVKVKPTQLHLYQASEKTTSADGQYTAWRYQDSVFVLMPDSQIVRLSHGGPALYQLSFLTDNRLMARADNSFLVFDLTTGEQSELVSWQFAKSPGANKAPADFIAAEQQSLIQYIQVQRKNRADKFAEQQLIDAMSPAAAPTPVYFNPDHKLIAAKVSPDGQHAIFVTTENVSSSDASDIMPHYIQENGRIAALNVRSRVADAKPINHTTWLVDINKSTATKLSYVGLPGYNDDVLADVKRENAAALNEKYVDNRLPRDIRLMGGASSIQWHSDGSQVALMLEAWDNKDRWIATVDMADKRLETVHRLHDDAWINYRHNKMGWLNNYHSLYFQSEHSGYSHIYLYTPGEKLKALTTGQFVATDLTLSGDDQFIYFKANKKHPGIYEIYRVNVVTGEHQQLTDLNGMTDYKLSQDGKRLLLTHSTVTRPPELYTASADGATDPVQITRTVSEAYLAKPWATPKVIAIPSSHTEAPIYARLYLPEDYDKGQPRKAVVFNHGAGYLQNSHLGWSLYFREFMFHSLLVQHGYVVLDMDYRASAGYGRDWRTAIYRKMGTPEIEDNIDGVNWLVENVNVDRQRIGTYGGSYGGFLTFMALFTEPDLYAAGAALRPVSDWAHYNIGYTSNILNTPEVDPIAYRRSSPIYFAEGLEKPLLINAPMVDDNVFFVDVVRLVQRLIELEKDSFDTAIYPVEPHGFVQPSSWLDEYRRIFKLFEEEL